MGREGARGISRVNWIGIERKCIRISWVSAEAKNREKRIIKGAMKDAG